MYRGQKCSAGKSLNINLFEITVKIVTFNTFTKNNNNGTYNFRIKIFVVSYNAFKSIYLS